MTNRRKVGTTSSHPGPYGLGYTRATMARTAAANQRWGANPTNLVVVRIGSATDSMKSELLVIANQNVAVNTFPGLVHTARHTMGVGCSEVVSLTFRRTITR